MDFSKAPKDATHYHPTNKFAVWYKKDELGRLMHYNRVEGTWHPSGNIPSEINALKPLPNPYQLTKFPIKCWYRESTSEWIAEIEYCSIGGSFNTSRYPNKSLTVAVVELLEHLKKEGVLCNVPSQN